MLKSPASDAFFAVMSTFFIAYCLNYPSPSVPLLDPICIGINALCLIICTTNLHYHFRRQDRLKELHRK